MQSNTLGHFVAIPQFITHRAYVCTEPAIIIYTVNTTVYTRALTGVYAHAGAYANKNCEHKHL